MIYHTKQVVAAKEPYKMTVVFVVSRTHELDALQHLATSAALSCLPLFRW
jgi:hypothetical protein